MEINKKTSVILEVEEKLIPGFFPLLGQGFGINVQAGCSVRDLLCRQLGISDDYLETRIQTIFLNGKPVDNVNTAVVKEGSVLALSAAMPGLAGAVLRRGGYLAPMRSQISHAIDSEAAYKKEEMVVLKLFNLLVREIGPIFLQNGIWLHGEELKEFIDRQGNMFDKGLLSVEIDGGQASLDRLQTTNWGDRQVHLRVAVSGK
jgi:hypothetical protein